MEKFSKKSVYNSLIDFLFSDDIRKHLIWIVLLGFLLRILMANNIHALGDEMIHGPRAIGFLHSGLLSTILQTPLWLYLTSITYSIMGVTMISSRFLSVFFGSLTIIMVYLLASKFFNKKVGIVASFLLALSFYIIRYSLAEMDLAATFFLMIALYSLINDSERKKFPYLAAICIGLAALIKTLALFFVPAFFITIFLYNPSKKNFWLNTKKVVLFGLIILAIYSPIIIHNYLWYQDKGLVDTYFAQYFFPSIRENYAGQLGYTNDLSYFLPRFFIGVKTVSLEVFKFDYVILSLGVIGLILAFFYGEKRRNWWIMMSYFLSGFILLILSNWLATHYTTLIPIFVIFSAYALIMISQWFNNKFNMKNFLTILLIIILLAQIFVLWPYITHKSSLSKIRSYAINQMDKESVVVVDSRMYRGRVAWAFNDFHYLEASLFPQLMQLNQNLSGASKVPLKIYFVECVTDDCGWGTISGGELNDSSEALVSLFSQSGKVEKTIYGGYNGEEEPSKPVLRVYSAMIDADPRIIPTIDSTHNWFYYPINYVPKEQIYDNYEVRGFFNNILYGLAWIILVLSIVASIVLIAIPFYYTYKQG